MICLAHSTLDSHATSDDGLAEVDRASELVIIDAQLDDLDALIAGVAPGMSVALLRSDRDGILQISEILKTRTPITALHILSHGAPGQLQLGNSHLSAANINHYAPQLQAWQQALAPTAEILLYGCRVAAQALLPGGMQPRLLQQIHQLTGAPVAASSTLTGNRDRGGNWCLDVQTGVIRTPLAITPQAQQSYRGLFATFTVDTVQDVVNANDGVLSLREAIQAAALLPGTDTIVLNNSVFLNSTLPVLVIGNDINLVGNNFAIDGQSRSQLLVVDGASVTMDRLTLVNGLAQGGNGFNGGGGGGGFGGGLFVKSGTVTITNSLFQSNRAVGGSSLGFAGNGGSGGNDSVNGFNGGNGGRGGSGSNFSVGVNGGAGGAGSIASGFSSPVAGVGGAGSSTNRGFGAGGGAGGGGGGGAGGAGNFRSGGNGAPGGNGGAGEFGGGGGGGAGGGGGGANVFGIFVATSSGNGGNGGFGGAGGMFGGAGSGGSGGGTGQITFLGDSPGVGGSGGRGGGGAGLGSAIFIRGGIVNLANTQFVNNSTTGGNGANNGQEVGTIFAGSGATLNAQNLSFQANTSSSSLDVDLFNDGANVRRLVRPFMVLEPGASSIPEAGGQFVQFVIRSSELLLLDVPINYTVSGTATSGQDFVSLPGTVVMRAGQFRTPIQIQIIDDQLFDPNESITITLTPSNAYGLTVPNGQSRTITIVDNEQGGPIDPSGQWLGEGGTRNFVVQQGQQRTAIDFQGIGRGINPSPEVIREVDTIQFEGADLVAKNLLLTQVGNDLMVNFDGVQNTQAILKDFALENLDNLSKQTGATIDLGNILFDGQTNFQDSFDVFNADDVRTALFNRNTVTFLNNLDNTVYGFDNSDDVINAQGGNDKIYSLSGNDILRGGAGNDTLYAGVGADVVNGGTGDDRLYLGRDRDIDTVIYRQGDGTDQVYEFQRGAGGDLLSFEGIEAIDVVSNGSTTLFRLGDGIAGNAGFGSGQTLLELRGVSGFTSSTIALNLARSNTARLLFA